jgi:hypothetical protein
VSQSTRAPEEDARRYVEVAEHFWVIVKKEALRRFISVFSYSKRHIKAEKKSNRRRGDAEVRGGKGSFFPTNIFPSSDLRVSASPVRLFLLWLSKEMEPRGNAAESKKESNSFSALVLGCSVVPRLKFSVPSGEFATPTKKKEA